jgi:hypothetical protein
MGIDPTTKAALGQLTDAISKPEGVDY